MEIWQEYNPNPTGRRVGDCAVRAVAKALETDWDTAFAKITAAAFELGDMPSSDAVWGSVLRKAGFRRAVIPNECPDCYTAQDFAQDHPAGTYVLGFGGHVATLQDGRLYDSWNSTQEIPQFFWFKEE